MILKFKLFNILEFLQYSPTCMILNKPNQSQTPRLTPKIVDWGTHCSFLTLILLGKYVRVTMSNYRALHIKVTEENWGKQVIVIPYLVLH
jgi:hypothetical protein